MALVKVLNPAFYGVQTQQENKQSLKQRQGPSKIDVSADDNKKKKEDIGNITGNIGSTKKKLGNQVYGKGNDTFKNSNNRQNPNNLGFENKPIQEDFNPQKQVGVGNNFKNDSSSQSRKHNFSSSDHFEKEKKSLPVRKNYVEIFNGKYQTFLDLVNPLVGVRGKRMNFFELKYCIEEIYSIRFINETINLDSSDQDDTTLKFPNFVLEFLNNKYLKKPLVDQHSLDILLSLEFYRDKNEIIDIFAKFLNEELEPDDLEFYLYVRTCLEKELKTMFIEIARQQTKKGYGNEDFKTALNIKSCLNVANAIYGNEQEELLNSFMKKIEEILTEQKNQGIKKNLIDTDKILCLTLEDYHENKFNMNQQGNLLNENQIKEESEMKEYDAIMNSEKKGEVYENLQRSFGENVGDLEEKIARLKAIIGTYIKEKELDVFFTKLLTSYLVYEKNKDNIEETMASIKELVSKKVNLLIRILFDNDEKAWFNSLKVKEDDQPTKEYFDTLTGMIENMLKYEKLQDLPENLVESFGQTLLSTPELNTQINKLVMKRFE